MNDRLEYYCNDVKRFHDRFGLNTPEKFNFFPRDLFEFRHKFLQEELEEYLVSYNNGDLPTAIDSLIDLVYVTCGAALLHGIGPEEFNRLSRQLPYASDNSEVGEYIGYLHMVDSIASHPHLLSEHLHQKFYTIADLLVAQYQVAYEAQDQMMTQMVLINLYRSCLAAATDMRFGDSRWNLLWNDVQRANMAKERAIRAEDSKRGSTYDVIKPKGWTPPDPAGKIALICKNWDEQTT